MGAELDFAVIDAGLSELETAVALQAGGAVGHRVRTP
jgi:hypothetical protein